MALVGASADAGGLTGGCGRQRRHDDHVDVVGLDVYVVDDAVRYDAACCRIDFWIALAVVLDVVEDVRIYVQVIKVRHDDDRVHVRDGERGAMGHIDARISSCRACKAVGPRDHERNRRIRDDRQRRRRRRRSRLEAQVGDDCRNAVGELKAWVVGSALAGDRAAVCKDGKNLRVDPVRPPRAGLQGNVLAVHLHADPPFLRHCVRAVDDRPERRAPDVDVVLAVGQPDVYLAVAVSHDAAERIAVEVAHHRADVEVRPARRHRHAIDPLVGGVFRRDGYLAAGCVERAACDRREARRAAGAVPAGAHVCRIAAAARYHGPGGLPVAACGAASPAADARRVHSASRSHHAAPYIAGRAVRGARAVPSAADARAAGSAPRDEDAVGDLECRAGPVAAAADARRVQAARRRHLAAVDGRLDSALPVAAADAGRVRAALRDDLAGIDDDRGRIRRLALGHADSGAFALHLQPPLAGEGEFGQLEHLDAACAGLDAVEDVRSRQLDGERPPLVASDGNRGRIHVRIRHHEIVQNKLRAVLIRLERHGLSVVSAGNNVVRGGEQLNKAIGVAPENVSGDSNAPQPRRIASVDVDARRDVVERLGVVTLDNCDDIL